MCDLFGTSSHIHPDRIVGRLQNLELARQQCRVHEVTGARCQPLLNHLRWSTEADVTNHIQMVPQILLVGMLESGTGKDDVLATIPCIVDQPGKSLEPGLSIFVGQSDAPAHLLDVLWWMVVVGVTELPAEFGSQDLANGRFARARNTHEDHDHSLCLLVPPFSLKQ